MKIDTEGYESDVLYGARKTIFRHRPIIHCECLTPDALAAIGYYADKLGYTTYAASFDHYNPDNFLNNPRAPSPPVKDTNVLMWPSERALPADLEVTAVGDFDGLIRAPSPRWHGPPR